MDGPNGKPIKSLPALAAAESECHRCLLYRDATQAVPGEGPAKADFMLVGEQPGDKEDLAGKPFVGPAGRILDSALKDAGIAREDTFVTNAVKHFKHEMRPSGACISGRTITRSNAARSGSNTSATWSNRRLSSRSAPQRRAASPAKP
jgi:uracil-DNA glycosylase